MILSCASNTSSWRRSPATNAPPETSFEPSGTARTPHQGRRTSERVAPSELAGLDRAAIQHALYERAVNPRRTLRALNPAFAGAGNDDESVRAIRDPQDVLVLMAGGGGLYSMVMPSWGAGPHGNPYVSEIIELDQACAIPVRA